MECERLDLQWNHMKEIMTNNEIELLISLSARGLDSARDPLPIFLLHNVEL